jgi:hypothetical protein
MIVKLEFTSSETSENFEGVKVTIINKNMGLIDSATFRFADILDKNPPPHGELNITKHFYIQNINNNYEWIPGKPDSLEIKQICRAIDNYLAVFD